MKWCTWRNASALLFFTVADKGEIKSAYGSHSIHCFWSLGIEGKTFAYITWFGLHVHSELYHPRAGTTYIWAGWNFHQLSVGGPPYPTLHLEVHSHRDRSWVQKEVFGRSTSMTYVISPYITKTCINTQHVQYVRAWVRNATMSKHNLKVHRFVVCQTFFSGRLKKASRSCL